MGIQCTAVCKLRLLCEEAGELKLLLDVQECFGLVPAVSEQQRLIVEGFDVLKF